MSKPFVAILMGSDSDKRRCAVFSTAPLHAQIKAAHKQRNNK